MYKKSIEDHKCFSCGKKADYFLTGYFISRPYVPTLPYCKDCFKVASKQLQDRLVKEYREFEDSLGLPHHV